MRKILNIFLVLVLLLFSSNIAFATISNFPYGLSSFGVVLPTGGSLQAPAGDVYYVGSAIAGASDGNDGLRSQPFNTLNYAVGRCAANKGDRIYVLPGHTETVSSAGGLDLDVAGIEIVFLGTKEDQGVITLSTLAAADIDVDAANIRIVGGEFYVGIDVLANVFDVNAAGFEMYGSLIRSGATYQTTSNITLDGNADNCILDGVTILSKTAGSTSGITTTAPVDRLTVRNCIIDGDWSSAGIYSATANTNMAIYDNPMIRNDQSGDHAIELSAASTGFYKDNGLYANSLSNPIDPGSLVDLSASKAAGTQFTVTCEITSSSIPSNTQTAAAITGAAEGTLMLTDILINTDSTGLAGFTNIEFSVDNTNGVAGASLPIVLEAAAGVGASLSESKKDYTTHTMPMQIESGSIVYCHGDDSGGSGGGKAYMTLVFTRVTAGAEIIGVNL